MRAFRSLLVVALSLVSARIVRAANPEKAISCGKALGISYSMQTYYAPKELPSKPTTRCNVKDGKCSSIQLVGYLYDKPKGKSPHPLVILNHGSEKSPSPECRTAKPFLDAGYIVFVPIRRGHDLSTGVYFDEYTSKYCSQKGQDAFCKMEYLHAQVDDLEEAIKYAQGNVANVDRNRLGIVGHSFGGILTVFANAKDLGQRAVVDAAGGSESWQSDDVIAQELAKAVRTAVTPIYFFEPMNDASIDATIYLSRIAGHNCRQFQSALFPALNTRETDPKDIITLGVTKADYAPVTVRQAAHGITMAHPEVWSSSVVEFLDRQLASTYVPNNDLCVGTSHKPD